MIYPLALQLVIFYDLYILIKYDLTAIYSISDFLQPICTN